MIIINEDARNKKDKYKNLLKYINYKKLNMNRFELM